MCGRIACTLGLIDLCYAASCKPRDGTVFFKAMPFRDVADYSPSFNIPPTSTVPVIVSPEQRNFLATCISERLIVPMRFGIIPPWIKQTDYKADNLETHLCKIERARESKLYNPLLERGNRCVIPCIGYYEWQSTKSINKQPYFFFNKKNAPESLTETRGTYSSEDGWTGTKLLYLAGVYSAYTDKDGQKAYSFAIITRETIPEWKWVHHRMPVVLQSDKDVNKWIRVKSHLLSTIFEILKKPVENLAAHAVDRSIINNTRNNSPKCVEPMIIGVPKMKMMRDFLDSGSKSKSENAEDDNGKPVSNKAFSIKKWLTNTKRIIPKKRTMLENWLEPSSKKAKRE